MDRNEYDAYSYITTEPDYRHLEDRARFKALYEEVGTVEANRTVAWREEWMRHFDPRPESTILELGAHNGPNLLHYGRLGHVVDGVEISDTLIATFERWKAREPAEVRARIAMHAGWIEEFEPLRPYDYVLLTEVLEHVADPAPVLQAARRALDPLGGELYVTSPSTHWGNNTHVRGVPLADLERWLLDAGLRPTRLFEEDGRTFAFAV